ncbi:MAG: serine/threonine-protein kinase [bacterium]
MPHDQFSASDLLGSIVDDRFEVIEKLGEGGMGAVYKARQISMDRQVALKILLHDQRGDPISVERFRHEAYLASRLRHPNAIIIHDFGQSPDGLLYIAMEYLSGETLKDRLTRVGPLPVRSAVKIIGQTLRTIAEAHRMGLIHRDLKPDNIFLTTVEGDTDYVKVLDFGIAKLTAVNDSIGGYQGGLTVAGKIYGTPNYMSPEQIRGKPVDHQSDIYQLGVIFYEMLCGRRPFEAQTPVDVMMMHLRDAPPPLTSHRPDVPPELARTVMRALEKDRRLRFQSGDEFLENIENFKFNSGFYAVPVRMAAAMTAQTPLADDATIAQADAGELEELGQSALIDAIDFAEEKTVLEFDEGFNDPEEKTFFETDDEEDMVTSADAPPMPPAAPAAPPPGIHSMASFSAEIGQGAPRRPEDDSEIVELGEDEFERADPSLLVPIPDLEAQRAAAGQGRGTIAGMPGHNAPRYVTPAPPPAGGPGAVPNKPTLAGHPGAVGYGPPPPRQVGAAPAPGATLQQGSPAAIAPRAAPEAPWPAAPASLPPTPAPAMHPPAMRPHAVAPSVAGAPPLALSSASDAPDFAYSADFPAQRSGKGGLVLKILLGLLLVAGTAAGVVFLYPLIAGRGPEGPPEVTWPAALVVRSEPAGIELFDAQRYVSDTPTEIELTGPTEGHQFRFARGNEIFTVKTGGRAGPTWMYVRIPDGQDGGALGIAEITSEPPDAQVRLGDTELGRTPLLYVGKPGEAVRLVVTRDGATQTVEAQPTEAGTRAEVKLR